MHRRWEKLQEFYLYGGIVKTIYFIALYNFQ